MSLMINSRTLVLISLASVCLMIGAQCGQAAKSDPLSSATVSLVSKSLPAQTRTRQSRSLSDMFEKVKSKLFGSRKQGQVAASMQPSASTNVAAIQRQPWNEINSFNQQYPPMVGYQNWPQASPANQFAQQPFNSLSGYLPQAGSPSGSPQAGPSSQASILSLDQQQQSQIQPQHHQQPIGGIPNGVGGMPSETGGLLASASQLFTRFIAPNSAGSSSSNVQQANQQQASQVSQQQQNQYNEFASMLDSMVAQTGVSNQRQPGQFQSAIPQQSQMPQGFQQPQLVDTEMSGSSNIQSYLPASGANQPNSGSSKSSMVSLAEQLAPGAAFNKLVSFPFSLTNNDDPTKEGKYKLHIPFLNQHVKRSDQQAAASSAAAAALNQQQQRFAQQYLNSLINQQYVAGASQQQLMAQPSQVVASIVSPQQSLTSGNVAQSVPQSVSSVEASQAAVAPSSSSSSSTSSNSASSLLSAAPSSQFTNNNSGRQSWSVSDSQSNAVPSSSKLIPMSSSSSLKSAPVSVSAAQS